jgi:histidine triad (HIT) family protein
MSPEALELMLEQQKAQSQSPPPVYRMIVNKELDSVPVSENEEALAVLELRPIAKGHTIVIPKNAVKRKEDLSPGVIEFAKKIGEKSKKISSQSKSM